MQKNTTGQKWRVFAFNRTDNTPVTGDAANITAKIAKDWGTKTPVGDTNPTEIEDGYYEFDMAQAESNGNVLDLYPESSTADVQVIGVPGSLVTTPPNYSTLGIENDGDLTKVNLCDTNTDMRGTDDAALDATVAKEATLNGGVELSATGFDLITQTATGIIEIAKAICDRIVSSTNHNIPKSLGRYVRESQEHQGYEGGFIYIDTIGGVVGSEPHVNGTLDNPVNNMTDLNTLAVALKIGRFKVTPGSSLLFTTAQDKQIFIGEAWSLDVNGQSFSGSFCGGAAVSGICTGAIKPTFKDCDINGMTSPPAWFKTCGFNGAFVAGSAGDFFFVDGCHSSIAGVLMPSHNYGTTTGNVNFNFRGYHGGTEILNMGQDGTDNLSFDGDGQISIHSSSIGGTMRIAGHQDMTGRAAFVAAGGVVHDDARFAASEVLAAVEASTVLAKEASLLRVLGLVLENHVEDDIVYDGEDKTSSVIYLYDSAANATTHNKATGLTASYTATFTYTDGLVSLASIVKN